jgi:general stress protein 26
MAHEEEGLSPAEITEQAWKLADKIRIALFNTWDGTQQRVRPLSATVDRDAHAIYFLIGAEGGTTLARETGDAPPTTLVEQVQRFPRVSASFADPGASDYVVIAGDAEVTNDRAKIKELWTPFAKAWWDGPEDPDIRLLTLRPDNAELWTGPNKLVAYAVMLTAAATGAKPPVGDHGAVRL